MYQFLVFGEEFSGRQSSGNMMDSLIDVVVEYLFLLVEMYNDSNC